MSEMWYNLSQLNATDTLKLAQSVDNLFFFHFFGVMILITLFVIIFRAFVSYNNNPKVSFMYTSFFIAVLSVMFKLLSLLNDTSVFIAWGIFAIATALQFILD